MWCKPWTTRIARVVSTQIQVLGSHSQAHRGRRVLDRQRRQQDQCNSSRDQVAVNLFRAGAHTGHASDSRRVMMLVLRQHVDPLKTRCAAAMRNRGIDHTECAGGQRHLVHAVMKTGALIAITLWPKLRPTVSRRRQR